MRIEIQELRILAAVVHLLNIGATAMGQALTGKSSTTELIIGFFDYNKNSQRKCVEILDIVSS